MVDLTRNVRAAPFCKQNLSTAFHFIVLCRQETFELICNCKPECTELPAVFHINYIAWKFWACFQRHRSNAEIMERTALH